MFMKMNRIYLTLIFVLIHGYSFTQETIILNDISKDLYIGNQVFIHKDSSGKKSLKDIISNNVVFKKEIQDVPNLGITTATYWVKFTVQNNTNINKFLLEYSYPIIDEITFYTIDGNGKTNLIKSGQKQLFNARFYKYPNYIYDIKIPKGGIKTYILKIKSNEQIMLPLKIGKPDDIIESNATGSIIFGLYAGVIIVMFFYNLFIFISIRDKSYFYYVLHTILIGLTQAAFLGYTSQYLWPNNPWLAEKSTTILTCLVSIVGIEFMKNFLSVKKHTPFLNKLLFGFTICYFLIISLNLLNYDILSYKLMQMVQTLVSIVILITSIIIIKKGSREAKFYLFAWSILFIGVLIFFLKDFGILPYNNITVYTMPIGSAIEVVLLSFALADRINIMRKEKEDSQQKTVEVLKENEKIIKNQNIVLEQKVEERTNDLNNTLTDLKQTQSQLVDAEKMSSLGQLTAGIAHEINNPINFVSSNILPLRQDIDDVKAILSKYEELDTSENIPEKLKEINDLKKELDYDYLKTELAEIINGIEDGARRTTEIVSGLKNFSRLDEGEFKLADLNEGIKSTFLLVKSKLNGIEVNFDLGNIPEYECNPGKINQLVLNLMDNAIYAIHKNKENNKGTINIKTNNTQDSINLSILDNGIGIHQDNVSKLFDPFYTTKDVGEGTGLGLSIVRGIVDAHNGEIKVETTQNIGTEMSITFPLKK